MVKSKEVLIRLIEAVEQELGEIRDTISVDNYPTDLSKVFKRRDFLIDLLDSYKRTLKNWED